MLGYVCFGRAPETLSEYAARPWSTLSPDFFYIKPYESRMFHLNRNTCLLYNPIVEGLIIASDRLRTEHTDTDTSWAWDYLDTSYELSLTPAAYLHVSTRHKIKFGLIHAAGCPKITQDHTLFRFSRGRGRVIPRYDEALRVNKL